MRPCMAASALRSSRETCICEMSSSAAISDWVMPLRKRRIDDPPLALLEPFETGANDGAALERLVAGLVLADQVDQRQLAARVDGGRERRRRVCARGLERLDHVFFLDVGRLGELGDGWRAAELGGEVVDEARDAQRELLHPPRHMDAPRAVAEVAADLADDRRHGIGGELDATLELEAVDRLDQADRAHLDEVVDGLAAARVAPCERVDERHHLLDQAVAGSAVAGRAVRLEKIDVGSAVRHDHHPASLRTSSSSSHSWSPVRIPVDAVDERRRRRGAEMRRPRFRPRAVRSGRQPVVENLRLELERVAVHGRRRASRPRARARRSGRREDRGASRGRPARAR